MDQKKRLGLKGLLASRNKGGSSKEAPKTQPTVIPPPPPPTDLGLLAMSNLKKRRPDQELEEGELIPRKENKQQKMAKDPRDRRGPSVEGRDEAEMDGAAIPYDVSIWDVLRSHANCLAQALQQPLLLPRDMDSIWRTK